MGCGNGNFIKYCNDKGIYCEGLTISENQAKYINTKGLVAHNGSYVDYHSKFKNKFDIIIFMGSLEHISTGWPGSKDGIDTANNIRKQIFNNCKLYFIEESTYKYIYHTTLHINPKFCNTIYSYFLERAYGGWYYLDEDNKRIYDVDDSDFSLLKTSDMSWHYYFTSIVDEDHFGNPAKIELNHILAMLFGFIINPFLVHMDIYTMFGFWMWMFDNKLHTYYEDRNNMKFIEDIEERPTTTWWGLLKYNK